MEKKQSESIPIIIEILDESDDIRRQELTYSLSRELRDLEAGSVHMVTSPAEAGSKPGDAITWGSLALVTLPALLPKVVEFLGSWTMRSEERKISVKTQVGDRSIEIEYSPNAMPEDELMIQVNKLLEILDSKE